MLTYQQVCEKVKAGEVTFDVCGHQVDPDYEHYFLSDYKHILEHANGAGDGKWTLQDGDTLEIVNARMRESYQNDLTFPWEDGLPALIWRNSVPCFGCGEELKWVRDGDVLTLRHYWDGTQYTSHMRDYRCPYEHPKPTRGVITVRSKLVFANFFLHVEDEPEGQKYKREWSLNHLQGREKITRFKAEHNVAYGQMGNMSVGVYVSPDRRSIILGDPYVLDRRCEGMTDAEYDAAEGSSLSQIEGHEMVGKLSLTVWRWEATDLQDLGDKYYQEALQRFGRNQVIEVEVPHGTWCFEHLYSTDSEPEPIVYERLRLEE